MTEYVVDPGTMELIIPFRFQDKGYIVGRRGKGYLAGTFPDGITSVEGIPSSAEIRVLLRRSPGEAGDGAVVAVVQSASDGTWAVEGLNPNFRYDVVCRHEGYNDMILSNVIPALPSGIEFLGNFHDLTEQVQILHGKAHRG